MRSCLVLCSLLIAGVVSSRAQSDVVVAGQVVDTKGQPLAFATVALLRVDSTVYQACFTNESGEFKMEKIDPGHYRLVGSLIGYRSFLNNIVISRDTVVHIHLQENINQLQEVTVNGQQQWIQRNPEGIILNVEKNVLAQGENVLDVLRLAPGVVVDGNGNITVNGKQGVRVMIDGRSVMLSEEQLKTMLSTMSATRVKEIEVVTNPSAKYDAEGTASILHIKTKKNKEVGLYGETTTRFLQGRYSNYGMGVNLNYKRNSVNWFTDVDAQSMAYFSDGKQHRKYQSANQSVVYFDQESYEFRRYNNLYAELGMDWFLSDKHTVGALVEGDLSRFRVPFETRTLVSGENQLTDSIYQVNNLTRLNFSTYDVHLNYSGVFDSTGRTLTANYDYALYDDHQLTDFQNQYTRANGLLLRPVEQLSSTNPSLITIHTAKVDYTHPFSKQQKIEVGGKLSFIRTDNDILFERIEQNKKSVDTTRTNHFLYDERISALYGSWSGGWKNWSMQAGLRGEHTHINGRSLTLRTSIPQDYFLLFPSVFVQRPIGSLHQLNFSYSRRINRPGYYSLNPFRIYLDPYSYVQGNAGLRPELVHSIELSYMFKQMYTFSISYAQTDRTIQDITFLNGETKEVVHRPENLDKKYYYSASLTTPFRLGSWGEVNHTLMWYYTVYQNRFQQGDFQRSLQTVMGNAFVSIYLPQKMTFQLSGWYQSPTLYGNNQFDWMGGLTLGVKKKIGDGRASINLKVTDVFLTQRERVTMDFFNQYFYLSQFHDSRRISLTFVYNFSRGARFETRDHTSGNREEKQRK